MNFQVEVRLNGDNLVEKIRKINENAKSCKCFVDNLVFYKEKDIISFLLKGTKSNVEIFTSSFSY